MGMGAARKGRRGGFRDINITPLVDVMLVLVIVFMVTAPLLTTGLRINLPEVHAANTPVKDARLLVTVTKDEKVLFVAAARNSGVESLNLLVQPELEPDTEAPEDKKKPGAKGP